MKIFHIGPDISYEANGVTPVVNGLGHYAIEQGDQVTVCALGAKLDDSRINFMQARRSRLFPFNEYSSDFSRMIKLGFREFDIVHGHSLWSAANLATGLYARGRAAKLIVSPHGTLSPWALSRRGTLKKVLWPVQNLALARADLVHATADSEVEEIRQTGYRGPIAMIPNGVAIPTAIGPLRSSRKKRILFLGRIHPIKGIENLLLAWKSVSKAFPKWELAVAGVGEPAYEATLKSLANSQALERVFWLGPVYGEAKVNLYKDSSLFVLPSFSENFGMVVTEAMSYALPCIVSKGAPWSVLPEVGAGWWIENTPEALSATLAQALALPAAALTAMGAEGRSYVEDKYSWGRVGHSFNDVYRWLVGNGSRPNFIHV